MNTMEREREHWKLSERLTFQFANRKDIHARQLDDGRYWLIKRPFTPGLMYLHLKGEVTLGTYLLDQLSRAKFTVLDADDDISGLQRMHIDLTNMDIPSYLEGSRRGGHLWFFFREQVSSRLARGFGLWFEKAYGIKLEVYPKQETTNGPGSLIRVPFGVHRKSGQRYGFIGLGNRREQMEALSNPHTISLEVVQSHQYREERRVFIQSETINSISLVDVIGQYVDLHPIASGFIGLCPFHDDKTPSFGINVKGNYWHCFAGCGGGDVVSFYMKLKNISYAEAVKELEKWTTKS